MAARPRGRGGGGGSSGAWGALQARLDIAAKKSRRANRDRHNRHFFGDAEVSATDGRGHVGAVSTAVRTVNGENAVDSMARTAPLPPTDGIRTGLRGGQDERKGLRRRKEAMVGNGGGEGCAGARVIAGGRVARAVGSGRMQAATATTLTVSPLTTRPPNSSCEPNTPPSTMYTRTPLPVRSPSLYLRSFPPPVGRASDEGARAGTDDRSAIV